MQGTECGTAAQQGNAADDNAAAAAQTGTVEQLHDQVYLSRVFCFVDAFRACVEYWTL